MGKYGLEKHFYRIALFFVDLKLDVLVRSLILMLNDYTVLKSVFIIIL